MNKKFFTQTFITACALMSLSIALGAFGAHILKNLLDPYQLSVFKTGIEYQFYHALGLFVVAFASLKTEHRSIVWAKRTMIAGMIFFSGSLYILTLTNLKWLGAIAPLGGILLIMSWVFLAYAMIKGK